MSNRDEVARLREIKRLLDRIQQLPHIVGAHANGLPQGFHAGLLHPAAEPEPPDEPPLDAAPPPLDTVAPPALELPHWERAPIEQSRALVPVQPSASVGISPWMFVIATVVNTMIAAVLAVVITLGVARRDSAPAEVVERVATSIKPAEPHGESALPRLVELLPVGSPREPLRLEASKPARLPLQVRPEEASQDSYFLLLKGLPANATLSGASPFGTGTWLLGPGDLQRLEIMVPEWSVSVFQVGVELRRANGAVVAQSKLWLAVPPPTVPNGAELDETALKQLVRQGDQLLTRGEVVAARALYERAAAMGSAQAALALGSTYDPRRLWSLGVFGMPSNKDRARQWYQRADELGHPEAKARISGLK
jgi:hypothetical protein